MNEDNYIDEKITRLLRGVDVDVPPDIDGRIQTAAANLRQYQGQSLGSRHKILLTCLGITLIAAVSISIWISVKRVNPASVSDFEALSRTLSLVMDPSTLSLGCQPTTGAIQEESKDYFLGRALLYIIKGSSYQSQSKVFNIAPLFTPDDISRIIIKDRVIEKTLKLIKGDDKEV